MRFKFLNLFYVTARSCLYVPRNNQNTSFQLKCLLQSKVQFCTKSNDDSKKLSESGESEKFSEPKESEESGESKLQKLLDKSSPLKPSPEAEKFWATSSFVEGTVFQGDDKERVKIDPKDTSIIMFPGQGNQFVGMATNIIKYPVVKDMFDVASDILGYNLLKLCQDGPEEKLNKTEYCQPAMLVCSLGALEKLKDEKPWAINSCVGACGFSLGELTALVFSGCFSFEKGIKLVKLRAEAMQACSDLAPGGMMTVLFGANANLSGALEDAKTHCKAKGVENGYCSVATHLFPCCKVIAGHIEALNFIVENKDKYKLRKFSKLPVSGAFHTDHMKEAGDVFKQALQKSTINEPLIKIFSNVTGKPYFNSDDIKKKLPKQIYSPVKWEQTINNLFERAEGVDFPNIFECGPGNSLTVVLQKINNKASKSCYAVSL